MNDLDDFKFIPTPFIKSIVDDINNYTDKNSFSYKMTNIDAIWYIRNSRKEIIKYIKENTDKNVKITVKHNGLNIKIVEKCSLCSNGMYDFRKVLISDYSGIQKSNCVEQVKNYNRFIYCPKCGKKLTWLNFGGNKDIM